MCAVNKWRCYDQMCMLMDAMPECSCTLSSESEPVQPATFSFCGDLGGAFEEQAT